MPNDGFQKKQQEIKIKMDMCKTMTVHNRLNCQAEVDDLQNKLMYEINRKTDATSAGTKSLTFLFTKIGIIRTNAYTVQNAVKDARENFKEILSQKDYSFFDFALDVLWIVAGSALPALGTALAPMQKWRNSDKLIERFAGEFLRRNGNIDFALIDGVKTEVEKVREKRNQPNADVFERALLQVQSQLDLADSLSEDFLKKLQADQITPDFDIEAFWQEKGFGEYSEKLSIDTSKLANCILYKALAHYTKQNCRYVMRSGSIDVKAALASQDSRTYGEFKGMSQSSRYNIYAKFGKQSKPKWNGGGDYPWISGYRDMITEWLVRITIK